MEAETDPAEALSVALRGWYGAFNDLGRRFAQHAGMHGSDAAALVHITSAEDRGTPLTQTQLGRRLGLSTPATSSLLTRLEESGHVERHRGELDRRTVTVRATRAVHEDVQEFFRGVGDDLDRVARGYPDQSVRVATELVSVMTEVLIRHLGDSPPGAR